MRKIGLAAAYALFMTLGLVGHPSDAHAVAAGLAGTLGIVPGLGHVAGGEPLEGLGWFATVVGLYAVPNSNVQQAGWDLWQYSMYDAYRDAGPSINRVGHQSVFENYVAAYNPVNIVDPIGGPIVGYGALVGKRKGLTPKGLVVYGFVGMGEEGLFRGFLFPAFSDLFSSKWAGAITSSAIFSLVHVTGGRANLAGSALGQRFVLGMLFSWQADRNKYDLRKNIFAHAWYDIFVDKGGRITGGGLRVPIHF